MSTGSGTHQEDSAHCLAHDSDSLKGYEATVARGRRARAARSGGAPLKLPESRKTCLVPTKHDNTGEELSPEARWRLSTSASTGLSRCAWHLPMSRLTEGGQAFGMNPTTCTDSKAQ